MVDGTVTAGGQKPMSVKPTVTLDRDDPEVQAAREAEQTAYEHYGLNPTEHYIEIADLEARTRVVEVGEGPPLVLISGSEGKGMSWLPLLPELDEFTLYVMDRPGGGLSDGIKKLWLSRVDPEQRLYSPFVAVF